MSKGTSFKRVVVKEDPKTNLRAAKIHPVNLPDGSKCVVLAHLYWPYHDRSLFETVLQYLRDEKPDLVLLLGGAVSEDAFKTLWDEEDNYVHDHPEVPEVEAAKFGIFDDRVTALAKSAHDELFKRISDAAGNGLVIWTPSWTHLSMGNEVRLMEWIQSKKRYLDNWMLNHPDGSDVLSDPSRRTPKELSKLFELDDLPNVKVTRYGAGVLLNEKLLWIIGDFRRRNAGDAALIEIEQRGISVGRSFDGKCSSSWFTRADHTLPGLRTQQFQAHECGYLFDPVHNDHYGDYNRRSPGFWAGQIVHGHVDGKSVYFLRGKDGRRSFVVNGKPYTEAAPGSTHWGEEFFVPSKTAAKSSKEGISSEPAIALKKKRNASRKPASTARKTTGKKKGTTKRK